MSNREASKALGRHSYISLADCSLIHHSFLDRRRRKGILPTLLTPGEVSKLATSQMCRVIPLSLPYMAALLREYDTRKSKRPTNWQPATQWQKGIGKLHTHPDTEGCVCLRVEMDSVHPPWLTVEWVQSALGRLVRAGGRLVGLTSSILALSRQSQAQAHGGQKLHLH